MSRKSLPPNEADEARASFSRATSILTAKQTATPPRKFPSEAVVVRRLAEELALALDRGDQLAIIDELAQRLGAQCLEVQHQTLRALRNR